MFCNKENVNILTSLLVSHGVSHAVVCPGSRNAPIVHNLNECPGIQCHAVTDERSAGFYALGLVLATRLPVAVCVTSGSAVLNVMPAVAEAYYQHLPIVVISADRPAAWIDQQDGQTLPQNGVLGRFVRASVSLPEPKDETERWYCNRLVNEALIATRRYGGSPVHINVPISEPLFCFTTEKLPDERVITFLDGRKNPQALLGEVREKLLRSHRPMIVLGQMKLHDTFTLPYDEIYRYIPVIAEALSVPCDASCVDTALALIENDEEAFAPDFIIYIGGMVVSKRLKQFLRRCRNAETWVMNEDGAVTDTFMNLSKVVVGSCEDVLNCMVEIMEERESCLFDEDSCSCVNASDLSDNISEKVDFASRWNSLLSRVSEELLKKTPSTAQAAVVKEFEDQLYDLDRLNCTVHYANSMAVRLACLHAPHHICCNRGLNGIEGSLSTAAGFSLSGEETYCVIGDLSFFYDQNALWNTSLNGSLRILLLNNGGGGIFYGLKGLSESPACDRYIAARHNTTAKEICRQYGVKYLKADIGNMKKKISKFITCESERPVLLEVSLLK